MDLAKQYQEINNALLEKCRKDATSEFLRNEALENELKRIFDKHEACKKSGFSLLKQSL